MKKYYTHIKLTVIIEANDIEEARQICNDMDIVVTDSETGEELNYEIKDIDEVKTSIS